MKIIKYQYSNHAWGFNKEEIYQIDVENKEYRHFENGACDDVLPLPDDLLVRIYSIFEPIYQEFPQTEFAFDAPMFTLTIDDKTCTQIADRDHNYLYKQLLSIFDAFKKTK